MAASMVTGTGPAGAAPHPAPCTARPGAACIAASTRVSAACSALGEPDVVGGHGTAVPLREVRLGPVDQGGGVGELALQGLLVGLVGDEDRAGEAPLTELPDVAAAQEASRPCG
jgi:hypothetical protein